MMMNGRGIAWVGMLSLVLGSVGCTFTATGDAAPGTAEPLEWAIAIHGGAGAIPKSTPEEKRQRYVESLEGALGLGREILERGGSSLDAVERVIRELEDDPKFNAGKGSVFTHEGRNEMDASIMDGRDLSCGAVTGVTTVKNPISLARLVMERSKHVFFSGDGAEAFADRMEVERVDPEYFFTQERYDRLQKALEEERAWDGEQGVLVDPGDTKYGTVGVVALDRDGNLAAGTSTGGLTAKRFGRIGDSPVIGAGTYADNRSCAVSGTGQGEQFIRNAVAHQIAALMEHGGKSLQEAAEFVVQRRLKVGDGGVIALSNRGAIAMVFNTPGMFRGAADSTGRFEVAIWE
jgi:beta-aspartyl-peptidase (threonine type)